MNPIYKSPEGEHEVLALYQQMLDAWPVAADRLTVPTRHGDTFVLAGGPKDKSALVLLHGSAANSASWVGDMPLWSRDFRVYAVDVIGEPGLSAPSRPALGTDAYAEWLDDVLSGLGLTSASFAGLSLGGWLALDYAIRRPDRIEKLVLISPGGLGRNRNILLWALPLLLLGNWGRRKMLERIGGPIMADTAFVSSLIGQMSQSIFRHFNPRVSPLPVPTEEQLRALPMPVMAILGGKDAFIDAPLARDMLERNVKALTLRYLPEGLHFMPGQGEAVRAYLKA